MPECKFIEVNAIQSEPLTRDYCLKALKQIVECVNKTNRKDKSKNYLETRKLLGILEELLNTLLSFI